MTISQQRMFDIFDFTRPKPDKLTNLNKLKLKRNLDNDSDNVDSGYFPSLVFK